MMIIYMFHKCVLKRVSFGSRDCTKELKLECAYLLGQTSFCHLGFISDPLIVLKFHNETHDPKGQENKIYTIVKGRETFTVPVTSCSKVLFGFLWQGQNLKSLKNCKFLVVFSVLNIFFRSDVEELQCLWSEVRKEIEKMEEHLSRRLSSVLTGNDNFNTLTTMDIVQTVSIQNFFCIEPGGYVLFAEVFLPF